jgi:toxin YoeB
MKKIWFDEAWDDYEYWQTQDKKTLRRINAILKDIDRNGYTGIGRPEPLKHELSGWWSREIDSKNRLIYRIIEENGTVEILQCLGHYND